MKSCPKCGIEHDKLGTFCSRKCANSRTWTEADKLKKSNSVKQFYSTEAGVKRKQDLARCATGKQHTADTKQKISESVKLSITDEIRKKMAESASNRIVSDETRRKMSEIAKKRGFGGVTSKKKLLFEKKNGEVVYLQSSYEIRFAEILEKLDIQWERPSPFIWVDTNGIQHKYYPDFKIGNIYIDTKNDFLAKIDKPKIQAVINQNHIDIRIVTEDFINEEYVASLV